MASITWRITVPPYCWVEAIFYIYLSQKFDVVFSSILNIIFTLWSYWISNSFVICIVLSCKFPRNLPHSLIFLENRVPCPLIRLGKLIHNSPVPPILPWEWVSCVLVSTIKSRQNQLFNGLKKDIVECVHMDLFYYYYWVLWWFPQRTK